MNGRNCHSRTSHVQITMYADEYLRIIRAVLAANFACYDPITSGAATKGILLNTQVSDTNNLTRAAVSKIKSKK